VFVRGTSTEATRRWPVAWVPALTPAVYATLGGHRRYGLEMVRLRAGFFECSTLEVMERERLGLGDWRGSWQREGGTPRAGAQGSTRAQRAEVWGSGWAARPRQEPQLAPAERFLTW